MGGERVEGEAVGGIVGGEGGGAAVGESDGREAVGWVGVGEWIGE